MLKFRAGNILKYVDPNDLELQVLVTEEESGHYFSGIVISNDGAIHNYKIGHFSQWLTDDDIWELVSTSDGVTVSCTEEDLTLAHHCIDFEELLPEWAIGFAEGKLQLGAGLPTKDGRRTGNAHIIKITEHRGEPLYECLTDAGNIMHLVFSEVKELFYPPKYISSVEEVKTKFLREDK